MANYRKLCFGRETGPLLFAINFGRLASGLVPFGLIAFYASINEYMFAGVATSVLMAVGALSAPYKGRIVARYSPRSTVVPLSIASCTFTALGVVTSFIGGSFVVALTFMITGTLLSPPTPALMRSIWTRIALDQDTNRALHALDSTTEELIFAVTPLVTAAFWATIGPFWAIPLGLVCGLLANIIIIVFAGRPTSLTYDLICKPTVETDDGRPRAIHRSAISAYFSAGSLGLLGPVFGLGVSMGGLSILLPKWAEVHVGASSVSGVLLSIVSLSGFFAGLLVGKISVRSMSPKSQYRVAALLVAAGTIQFWLADSLQVAVVAAVLLGVGMTSIFISSFVLVGELYPDDEHIEMNAAVGSAFDLGSGAAGLGAGALVTAISVGGAMAYLCPAVIALSLTSFLIGKRSKQSARDMERT